MNRGGGIALDSADLILRRAPREVFHLSSFRGARKREPGIHTPDRGYGFRVQPCGLPRNDGVWCDGADSFFKQPTVIASQRARECAPVDRLRDEAIHPSFTRRDGFASLRSQ